MRTRSVLLFGLLLASLGLSASRVHASADVEAMVRASFADAPVMIKVAECESKFRQFTDAGNVLHGGMGGQMIGVYQLYDSVHRHAAAALGYNIDTILGNISYARYLYNNQGTDPWMSSFSCWNDKTVEGTSSVQLPPVTSQTASIALAQTISASTNAITTPLSFGMIDPQVVVLQQLLNAAGFTIAASGPGSPGQETTKFGALTRDAVRRFQCAKEIACSGDEYATGYGYVGVRTRSELSAAAQNPTSVSQATPVLSDRTAAINEIKQQIADLQKKLSDLEAGQ